MTRVQFPFPPLLLLAGQSEMKLRNDLGHSISSRAQPSTSGWVPSVPLLRYQAEDVPWVKQMSTID